ncbi:PFL_4669 family integrating conjugative element protein [Dickeya zeae]|uniref:PFL_4669 family integrating conjugative element protein n=1 Tax=Dickeya zeae TaxID=204042 RepID=UPI000399F0DB|nr:TIGR03761 family integrating conjugative element protein [Dickeya zeae]
MTEKTEKDELPSRARAGALVSELKIELHTNYAISLWEGRRAIFDDNNERVKFTIPSMPMFIAAAGRINDASLADNPFADHVLYKLDLAIQSAFIKMNSYVSTLERVLVAVPAGVHITDVVSREPLDIQVFSRTPFGYRCVYLLVGFDQYAKKVLQAYHFGFISRNERDDYLSNGSRILRAIYAIVQGYRAGSVTRQDVMDNSEAYQKALSSYRLKELNPAILDGSRRASFCAPLNDEIRARMKAFQSQGGHNSVGAPS